MRIRQLADGKAVEIEFEAEGSRVRYRLRGTMEAPAAEAEMAEADIVEAEPGVYSVLFGTRSFDIRLERTHYGTVAQHRSERILLETAGRGKGSVRGGSAGPAPVKAAMPGRVVRVLVQEGQQVDAGEGLLVLEAMKMQNEIRAPKAGTVRRLGVAEGATVAAGALLCVIEELATSSA